MSRHEWQWAYSTTELQNYMCLSIVRDTQISNDHVFFALVIQINKLFSKLVQFHISLSVSWYPTDGVEKRTNSYS